MPSTHHPSSALLCWAANRSPTQTAAYLIFAVIVVLAFGACRAQGQSLTNLAVFRADGSLGSTPDSQLTAGLDGNLYGVTQVGPNSAPGGEVFRVSLGGDLSVVVP